MLRVPTVSGDEGYVGLGQGPPTHTDLGEGLADSETGRVLGTGGGSLVSLGPWPFHCVYQDAICLQTLGGDWSEGPYERASPTPAASAHVPGLVGSQEGHQ